MTEETQEQMEERFNKEADEEMLNQNAATPDKELEDKLDVEDKAIEVAIEEDVAKDIDKLESKEGQFEFICNQYKQSREAIDKLNDDYSKETETLMDEIKVLQNKMAEIKKEKYTNTLDFLKQETDELKDKIIDNWEDKEVKTLKYDFGSFTRTERQSLEILDKELLITELSQKGLLNGAIKSFDDKLVKGWIDAKMGLQGAKINKNHSLTFKEKK